MEPVEELVQVRVPPRTVEVRVHGVSGTPPQALLSAFPMRVEGDANAGFYRARQADAEAGIAEAFSWGGLTSRSRVTALWLFLAPLALINVAGWMTPSPSRASQRGSAYQVRRVAMRLVTVAATVLASAIAVQAAATVLGLVTADAPVATLAAVTSVGLAALVPLGLHLLSKVGGAPDDHEDHEDVFGRAHSLHGLSAGHLGIGLSTVALLGGIVAGADPLGPVAGIGILVAMVGLALGTAAALQTRTSGPDVEPPEGRRAVVAGVAALVMVGAGLALDGAGVFPVQSHGDPDGALTVRPEALTVAHFTIAGTAAVLLAVALLAERRMPVRESAGHSVAFAALGFFMSYSAFGALSYGLLGLASEGSPQAFLEDPEPAIMFRFIDYSAVVLTCAALWVAARIAGEVRPLAPAGEHGVDAARRLRAAVNGATGDLRRAGTGLLIAALVLVLAELLRLAFEGATWAERLASVLTEPRMVLGAVGWLFVAYLVVRVCRGRRGALAIAAVGIAAVGALVWLVDQGGVDLLAWARLDTDLPGTAGIDHPSVPATAFTMGAVVLALFVPAASVLYFVFSASGNRESRRGVGVLWDLTNFWPRLYHPWAPPPYSETAIPALERRLRHLHDDHPDDALVLSCHSQGAVLGFPVLRRVLDNGEVPRENLRFLAYGNLLAAHYQRLFPEQFDDDQLLAVERANPGRWIQLFRETDPLGHPIPGLGDNSRQASHEPPRAVGHVLTHANYSYSPEFQAALNELGGGDGTPGDGGAQGAEQTDTLGDPPSGWKRFWLRVSGS